MGRVTDYIEYKDGTTNLAYERQASYDAKSQVTTDTTWTYRSDGTYKTVSNYFYNADANADGNWTNDPTAYQGGAITHIVAYNYLNGNWLQESDTANIYTWWDSAETSIQKYVPKVSDWSQNTSTYTYDSSGNLSSVAIADGRPRTVSFINTADGLVLQRDEADQQTGGDPRELHYYFDGIQVGDVSNNGTSDIDYAASIVEHVKTQGTGAFRDGGASVSYADFDQSYDPINGLNYQGTASHYTVQGGDTLQSIAQQIWGDSSFWYLIADANGLDGNADLVTGTDLIIPNKVGNIHNNTDTFRPYDPNEALGNVSPTAPPKHHASPCGVFGQILLTVIAIVVAYFTAGALAGPLADIAGTLSEAGGLGLSTAGTATAITGSALEISASSVAGVVGSAAAGVIGGAVGSIASQAVGLATGIQKSFNWGQVGMAAIGGGVGGGMSTAFGNVGSSFLQGMLRGVASNVITQGIGVATGLQKKFDWAGVAAAGIGGGVTEGLTHSFGVQNAPLSDFAGDALRGVAGMAGALANAATRTLIGGTDFGDNIVAALPDAIGQTIGSLIEGGIEGPATTTGTAAASQPTAGQGGGQSRVADPASGAMDSDLPATGAGDDADGSYQDIAYKTTKLDGFQFRYGTDASRADTQEDAISEILSLQQAIPGATGDVLNQMQLAYQGALNKYLLAATDLSDFQGGFQKMGLTPTSQQITIAVAYRQGANDLAAQMQSDQFYAGSDINGLLNGYRNGAAGSVFSDYLDNLISMDSVKFLPKGVFSDKVLHTDESDLGYTHHEDSNEIQNTLYPSMFSFTQEADQFYGIDAHFVSYVAHNMSIVDKTYIQDGMYTAVGHDTYVTTLTLLTGALTDGIGSLSGKLTTPEGEIKAPSIGSAEKPLPTLGPGWTAIAPSGPGAAVGPLPEGYTMVSRWVTPSEAATWMDNGGTAIPAAAGANGRVYVTSYGAAQPGGTGPVRIDFAVPEEALDTAGNKEWFQMWQPLQRVPIYNVIINVPPGTTMPRPR